MPGGLLSQAGDRQCSLSELGEGAGENQQSHKGHAGGTGMRGVGVGHAELGCQQHEQYPAGAWLDPGALLVESTRFCLPLHALAWHHLPSQPHPPGSQLAGQPVSTPLLWGRNSAGPVPPARFYLLRAKGRLLQALPLLPVNSVLSSARLWTKPMSTPPSRLCCMSPLPGSLPRSPVICVSDLHVPRPTPSLVALKAGAGLGTAPVLQEGMLSE